MIVGQLLYGWAARGQEGLNKQQIIAASGLLGDRSQAATRAVLRYCYRPGEDNFGWARRGGLDIVFRRTLTGLDGTGRPGAFLVHALISEPGTLTPAMLGELWDAGIWRRQLPDAPLDTLDALDSAAELQLRPLPAADPERLVSALGGYLSSLCAGRRHLVSGDGPDAVALAVGIVEALPVELGLPSFSTGEEGDRSELYDLLAVGGKDAAATPSDREIDELWLAAARVLLAAAAGDRAAHGMVAATLEETEGGAEFAERLHGWLNLERASARGGVADPAALADAAVDPRFALRLVESEAVDSLGRAAIEGNVDALRALAWTAGTPAEEKVVALLAGRMEQLPSGTVAKRLDEMAAIAEPMTRVVAGRVLEDWSQRGALPSFGIADALTLARILAGGGGPPDRTARRLLAVPDLAQGFASANVLPLSWRASAAAANPRAVSPDVMGEAIMRHPEFATQLLAEGGGEAEAVIPAALARLDLEGAQRALAHLERESKPRRLEAWRLATLVRLPASERLMRLQELARAKPRAVEYAEALIDSFIDVIGEIRDSQLPLPNLPQLSAQAKSERIQAWRRLALGLKRVSVGGRGAVEELAEYTRFLDNRGETDTALELIVDEIAKYSPSEARWATAIEEGVAGSRQTGASFAPRLIRAGLRGVNRFPRDAATWTICWIAYGVEDGSLSLALLEDKRVEELGRALATDAHVQRVRSCAKQCNDKPVRKWLLEMAKDAEREHPKQGRLARLRKRTS